MDKLTIIVRNLFFEGNINKTKSWGKIIALIIAYLNYTLKDCLTFTLIQCFIQISMIERQIHSEEVSYESTDKKVQTTKNTPK